MKEVFIDGDDIVVDSVGDGAIELSGGEIIVVNLLSDWLWMG